MKNNFFNCTTGFIVALVLVGCGKSGSPEKTSLALVDDPCVLISMSSEVDFTATNSSFDASIRKYQRTVSNRSYQLPGLERLGWAYVGKARDSRDSGYYKLAEQTALCMELQAPNSVESMLLQGHVLHNLHRFSEAEVLARQLVERRGAWFDYALLGDVLVERGSLQEAVSVYQKVVDQKPGPQAYARIAQLRWLKGDLHGALEMMAQAARSTSPRSAEPAAWVHVRLALMLMQAEELHAADIVLTRALTLKPGYPPALHARGRLFLAQERLDDAVTLLQQAVDADPLPEFRWSLYEVLQKTGQDEAASEQASALHRSGASEDRRTFALFLATMGDQPEVALRLALKELEQRKDVFTLDAVAFALSAVGSHVEALEYSRRALSEGTQDARLFLHAGLIAARAGERERALELLNRASAAKQMLLPSEKRQLTTEFSVLQPQISTLMTVQPDQRATYLF